MTLRGLSLGLAVAVLAFPSGAAAKGLASVAVCGSSGCASTKAPAPLKLLETTLGSQPHVVSDIPVGPYYRVDFGIRGDGQISHFRLFYVPPNLLRPAEGDGMASPFSRLPDRAAKVVAALADRVEPFAAPEAAAPRNPWSADSHAVYAASSNSVSWPGLIIVLSWLVVSAGWFARTHRSARR